MSRVRVFLMIVVSGVALLLIGWGSRAPYRASAGDEALLRLSWRLRPERNEHCRERTQAELDALPVHMRTPRVCETRAVPYRLILQIGDGPPDTTVVLGAGARHDRPIYIFRDSLMTPGETRVRVSFQRADSSAAEPLVLNEEIEFRAGHIELITLADDAQLVHRSAHQRHHDDVSRHHDDISER